MAADPYRGTVEAVLECAANLACVGAAPLGTTNNLNFGNPEKPHIAWQLTESVRGLGDACRALEAPIVGGNVSLYNEGAAGPIYPTPVIGMVGELPDARRGRAARLRRGRRRDRAGGAVRALARRQRAGQAARRAAARRAAGARPRTRSPPRRRARRGPRGALASAHDIAEGGLAVALAECCLAGARGARVRLATHGEAARALFGECSGCFVVCGEAAALDALSDSVTVLDLGSVGGDELAIEVVGGDEHVVRWPSSKRAHAGGLARCFP